MRTVAFITVLTLVVVKVTAQSPAYGQCGGIGWCVPDFASLEGESDLLLQGRKYYMCGRIYLHGTE